MKNAELASMAAITQEGRKYLEVLFILLKEVSTLLLKLSPREFTGFCTAFIFICLYVYSVSIMRKKRNEGKIEPIDYKEHVLRVGGLFLIAALTLFIHNAWVSFLAILITGTTVTSQEFLKNIAAIAFRVSDFFTSEVEKLKIMIKIQTLSDQEATEIEKQESATELTEIETQELVTEVAETEKQEPVSESNKPNFTSSEPTLLTLTKSVYPSTPEGTRINNASAARAAHFLKVKKLAVMTLGQMYQGKIEHHVRFSDNRGNIATFNGLIETKDEFVFAEVHFIPVKGGRFTTHGFTWTHLIIPQFKQASYFGSLASKKSLVFHLVVVGEFPLSERLEIQSAVHNHLEVLAKDLPNIKAKLNIFTGKEIFALDKTMLASPVETSNSN